MRIVTYIPNNAYLVYGGADVCTQCNNWPPRSVSAMGGRIPPLTGLIPGSRVRRARLDNRSGQAMSSSQIQLVEDAAENATTLALIGQLKLEPILAKENALGYVNIKVALPKEAVINQIAKRGDVVSIQPFVTPKRMMSEKTSS